MRDDDENFELIESDPLFFEDPIAQRAVAFVQVAHCADNVKNDAVRDITLTMMRKLSASIKTPPTAELRAIKGGLPANDETSGAD